MTAPCPVGAPAFGDLLATGRGGHVTTNAPTDHGRAAGIALLGRGGQKSGGSGRCYVSAAVPNEAEIAVAMSAFRL